MLKILRYFFVGIILIFGIVFALLNAEFVSVNFYFQAYQLPLSLLLALIFGVGILMGYLFACFKHYCTKK